MPEQWKAVRGFEGTYEVSDQGRIKRLGRVGCKEERIIKQTPDKDGYIEFATRRDGKTKNLKVHRLVYEAFVSPIPPGFVINHKDNDKQNNVPSNLEPMTIGENNRHAAEWRKANGIKVKRLTRFEVLAIRRHISLGTCKREIAKLFKVPPRRIYDIEKGRIFKSIQ